MGIKENQPRQFVFAARGGWLLCSLAVTVRAADDRDNNVGQSVAHPLSRFDLRVRYMAFEDHKEAEVLEARLEHPFDLEGGWKLNTRVVLSGWVTDFPSGDNRGADYSAGVGDLYTQLFFIAPAIGATTIAVGWRNYFPSAGEDQFGKGKYRCAPLVVVQRAANWISPGSFYGLGLRHDFSFAGDRAHRKVNELQVVPVVTVMLPHQSFVTLFPERVIDWQQDNRLFVPLDVEVGRKYAANRAASLRLQVPLLNELQPYEWAVEARWSVFF